MALYPLDSGRQLAYYPGDNLPNWHNLIAAIPLPTVPLQDAEYALDLAYPTQREVGCFFPPELTHA